MATTSKKIEVEQTMRQLLADNDLPQPDEVEYEAGTVNLIFNEPKVVLAIDIDEPLGQAPPEDWEPDERSLDAELN
jgi:hypothetical protein